MGKLTDIEFLALDTIKKEKQALVFVNSKASAEAQAERVSKKLEGNPALDIIAEEILKALSNPTKQCKRLAECVRGGTAFHHSGLNSKQRELVEDSFKDGIIKIICCTPTLAAGLDMPAYRSIIKDLKRYTKHGMQYIPVLEYLQMAGRAGRPKYDKEGEAICLAQTQTQKDEIVEQFIKGKPEKIYSKLSSEPILRTYILSLVATEVVKNEEELFDFFSKTFFAHQYGNIEEIKSKLLNMIKLLQDWGFIKGHKEEKEKFGDFLSASELVKNEDEDKYEATILGKRISELYLDPYTANELIKGLKKEKEKNEFSYLHLICNTFEMRPLLSILKKDYEIMEEQLSLNEEYILDDEIFFEEQYTLLQTIKTAYFFKKWIDEMEEDKLLETFNIRPGEIKYKTDTADWLLYACYEISKILMLKENLNQITKLRVRLKYGVKEELLSLVKIKTVGKARARKLYSSGIKNVRDLNNTGIETLKLIVGDKTAVNIKHHLSLN